MTCTSYFRHEKGNSNTIDWCFNEKITVITLYQIQRQLQCKWTQKYLAITQTKAQYVKSISFFQNSHSDHGPIQGSQQICIYIENLIKNRFQPCFCIHCISVLFYYKIVHKCICYSNFILGLVCCGWIPILSNGIQPGPSVLWIPHTTLRGDP